MTQCGNPIPGNRIPIRIHPSMKPIVPEFLKNAREDVAALRGALKQGDYETIARLGHSMKGGAGFGFDYLIEIGLSLEDTARIKESSKIGTLVNKLEDYLDRVEPVYDPA
jgi:HPt (histidine-containing phosphotransfer) domain-containing protein